MAERIIFHVDVNSAFLSWSAAHRLLVLGEAEDLREIPSVVGGDESVRHGVVLAKSLPAKKFGVQTGEPIFQAKQKCPQLVVVPPDFEIYVQASRKFIMLLRTISPSVEQFSIDEAWVDMTGTERLYGSPAAAAHMLKNRIREELGFTVNVGVSSNKILAKIAGDLKKPDMVHTLFAEEIPEKLWPLSVRDLFTVGAATEKKLARYGIKTVGALARTDPAFLREKFGKHGESIWHLANGRSVDVLHTKKESNKSYGNSTTTAQDVKTAQDAYKILLSLCETVGMRLRRDCQSGICMMVHFRTTDFLDVSHQLLMPSSVNVTAELYEAACCAFDALWERQGRPPMRQLGVQVTRLRQDGGYRQYSLFDRVRYERMEKMDAAVDALREKFGEESVFRARFLEKPEEQTGDGRSEQRCSGRTKEV